MRKAVIATRTPTPHPNPSPRGEGLDRSAVRSADVVKVKALLPGEKGWDEGQRWLKTCARQMRRAPTDVENKLWQQLRNRRLDDHKFRRQVPVGPFIVDFLCEARALIIELDGGQHADSVRQDAERSAWLRSQGFHVVRFWNNDVVAAFDSVLEQIRIELSRPGPAA